MYPTEGNVGDDSPLVGSPIGRRDPLSGHSSRRDSPPLPSSQSSRDSRDRDRDVRERDVRDRDGERPSKSRDHRDSRSTERDSNAAVSEFYERRQPHLPHSAYAQQQHPSLAQSSSSLRGHRSPSPSASSSSLYARFGPRQSSPRDDRPPQQQQLPLQQYQCSPMKRNTDRSSSPRARHPRTPSPPQQQLQHDQSQVLCYK